VKVGIDWWPASTHAPGLGRYLRELVRALCALEQPVDGPLELRLLDVGPLPRRFEPPRASRVQLRKARVPRRALALTAGVGLGADRLVGGCEVFHHVVTGFPRVSRARATLAAAELPSEGADLSGYDAVLTFSRWGAAEIARRCGVPRERVHELPVGCEHFARDARKPVERRDPPLVLCLGRLSQERAPTAVLAACERLRGRGVACRLAFVGRRGDAYDELRARVTRSPMSASVSFSSDPTEDELASTVAGASVLAHLSEGELSAVTPLEALACGAAVVATRSQAFVESLGEHARWIDASPRSTEPSELADALELALADARDANGTRERLALAASFTWERHARLTLDLWRRILGRRSPP
jgi:glycosyltransferase involved in cell wall biosynthesis